MPKLLNLDDLKKVKKLRPEMKMTGNNLDIDSIYNHSIPKKPKFVKGMSYWDNKKKRQLVYDSVDKTHGGLNFFSREGDVINLSTKDNLSALSSYKGRNKLDHDTLKAYNTELNRFQSLTDPYFNLKYNDPESYYSQLTENINKIDSYEKDIKSKYKGFKGNKDYHKTRSYMSDEINNYYNSNVLDKDPLKLNTQQQTNHTYNRELEQGDTINLNTGDIEKADGTILKEDGTVIPPPETNPLQNELDKEISNAEQRRNTSTSSDEPKRTTKLTPEEQAAVDRANEQWRTEVEARNAQMDKEIQNMLDETNQIYGSPEDIMNPNYVSKFDPDSDKPKYDPSNYGPRVENPTPQESEFKPFKYDPKNVDPETGPVVLNNPIIDDATNPNKLHNPIYNNPHVPKEKLAFDPNNPLSWTDDDIRRMASLEGSLDSDLAQDLLDQRTAAMNGTVYKASSNSIDDIDLDGDRGLNKHNFKSAEFDDISRNAPDTELLSRGAMGVVDKVMTGINVIGAIGDYKARRREGHGIVSSAVRTGAEFAINEALGLWALPIALVKSTPGMAIKGAEMLYKENRRMNSAANFQVFGDAQFMDTQQLATMRQSGMEMAKMSQYNLQQTLMGNEAAYLHR